MKKIVLILMLLASTGWAATISSPPPDDTAYNSTTWDGSLLAPTKNAVRDYLESIFPSGVIGDAELAAFAGLTSAASTIPYFTGSGTAALIASPGAEGKIIRSGASPYSPAWTTATFATSYAAGSVLYSNGANTVTGLGIGTAYQILQTNSGATAPEWTSSLSISAINLSAATLAVPMVVNTTTTELTTAGSMHYESDADILSIGDGTTDIDITFAPGTAYVFPDYSGSIPIIIAQGYTQTLLENTDAVTITGSEITLADGWFTEGKTLKYVVGGTVTGANGTISVILSMEGGAVMTLTTADGAAGDWVAEFTVIATTATAQKIIGKLTAEAGAEVKVDYAAGTVNTTTAGTIPVLLQLDLGHADDAISSEYVQIWYWNKAD